MRTNSTMNFSLLLGAVASFEASNREFIFVLGAPRSGTSLLKNLLCTHSQLYGTRTESAGFFRAQNFEKKVFDSLSESHTQEILRSSKNHVHAYDFLTAAVVASAGKLCFVDKVTPASWRYRMLQNCFPRAKYIHIVRDGRDGYCSAVKHGQIKQARSVKQWAKYWRNVVTLPRRIFPQERVWTLRYEDLVREPKATMSIVMDFLGYPFEERQIDSSTYKESTILHKSRVYHRKLSNPIGAGSVGRYVEDMSKDTLVIFNRIAGRTLLDFGYHVMAK